MMTMKTLVILFALLAPFQARAASSPAPFQVSIQWKNLYGAQTDAFQFHICSGIIIHEKYVLTVASCLLFPIMNTEYSRLILASELTVIAGFGNNNNNNNGTSQTERNVVSIIPHNKFSKESFDSDIAVLKLDRALPLANNVQIQWLDIASSGVGASANDSCFSTVFNASSQEFYSIVKSPSNLQHWLCEEEASGSEAPRKTDLCLEYLNAEKENCNRSSQSLHYSRERGSAYVCNNKLVAILADINRPKSAEKCFLTRQTTAFYVNATLHLEWLLSETGLTNLGMKNRSDTPPIPSWSSTTEAPPTNSSSERIDDALLMFIILVGALLVFDSNGFRRI